MVVLSRTKQALFGTLKRPSSSSNNKTRKMPALQVKAGSSLAELSDANVNNDDIGLPIDSDHFVGKLILRVKHYTGPDKVLKEDTTSGYFQAHPDATWSIQLQGKFKHDVDLDDIMFGNIWDHPIRDRLPYGTGIALRFLNWFDPALELDLQADNPWALSPLISTMQNVHVSNSDNAVDETKVVDVEEDTSALFTKEELEDDTSVAASLKGDSAARKKFFATKENRSGRVIPKDMAIQADFSNGFISFQDGVYLQLPVGGFKVDLVRVWDGKALKFVCTSRDRSRTYFAVSYFLILDGPADSS